jgi:polysaccharide pyruvyl transferase WcaK-like protein
VVLVGDIGGASTLHVGDEAMFEADLGLIRRLLPRARCTAVSADPAFTSAAFGIEAVARPSPLGLRDAAPKDSPALAAAAEADLLVVTGGGNLNSAFPTLITERLALARATADGGGAVVVLGQTVGPALTPADAERVVELFDLATFFGMRDQGSMAVARTLGVGESALVEQLDDAWAMDAASPHGRAPLPDGPVIAVTLHPDPRVVPPRAIGALADQLMQIVGHTRSSIVLVPHCRAGEGPEGRSDEDIAAGLAQQLGTRSVPVVSLPVLTPREVVGVTQAADLVISSRYHPVVFAQRAAVPALALWANPYVRAKQLGALTHAGLEAWTLPLDEAIGGGLVAAAIELYDRREELRAWLTTMRPSLEAKIASRDAQLAARLRDRGLPVTLPEAAVAREAPAPVAAPQPSGGWNAVSAAPLARPMPDPLLAEFFELRNHARSLEVERDATRSRASEEGGDRPPARSTRPTTVLDQVRLEIDAHRLALVGRISGSQLDDTDVRFRVYAPDLGARIDASATPLLPIATTIAARLGTDLVIDAPVDARALENAHRASSILEEWWEWRRPLILPATTTLPVDPAAGVGLWFSRGVDSTHTLLRALAGELVVDGRAAQVTHLLGLDWIDPPFVVLSTPDVWSETEQAAASIDMPLLRFTTDVRRVLDPIMSWEQSHGAVFAGLGLLVGPRLGTVLISGCAAANALPFGSHPALDPLWSTSGTSVVNIGADYRRSAKVARIARDPWAMRRLKVCWKADTARNCGRCSKCLVTATMLHAVGALGNTDRFDCALSADAVHSLAMSPEPLPTLPGSVDEILGILGPRDVELRSAWEAVRDRLRRDAALAT